MRARAFGFALIVLGATACSFVVDTTGFIGGSDDDASTTPDGTTPADADTEAAVTIDAGVDGDAAFVCPGVFCDSFDRPGEKLLDGWSSIEKNAPSEVSLDPTRGAASTPALHSVVAPSTTTGASASLYKELTTSATMIRLAFSARAEENIARHSHLAVLTFGKAASQYVILMFPQQTGALLLAAQEPDGFQPVQPNVPWGINAWHRYELTVTTGGQPKATLVVDGAKIFDGNLPYALTTPSYVSLGPNYTQAGPRTELWYDDVVLDLK